MDGPHTFYGINPIKLFYELWPEIDGRKTVLYPQQKEIIQSVWDNDETYVPAGNMLGKDFVSGYIALAYFLIHRPVRIITTSVKDEHLDVLWGEIDRFVRSCKYPLTVERGGPLVYLHQEIRRVYKGVEEKNSYLKGQVSKKGEGMAGHHAEHTLLIADEACHDEETDVLTEHGWMKFSKLDGSEKLLSMDPLTRIATYLRPTSLHAFHRIGKMCKYKTRGISFCVTPNHKMLWSKRVMGRYSKYYFQQISEILQRGFSRGVRGHPSCGERYIPRLFRWIGETPTHYTIPGIVTDRKVHHDRKVEMPEFLEFLGWYMSEGNLTWNSKENKPYAVRISQKDGPNLLRIYEVAYRLHMRPCLYRDGQSPSVIINDPRLAQFLSRFGRYCWEKRVPDFIGTLSPELIKLFLDAYIEGDGYNRENGRDVIYTSSERMADDLQILCYKCGRTASVTVRKLVGLPAPNGVSRHDGYVIGVSSDTLDSHIKVKRGSIEEVDYDGMVYCATVPPYHTLFTRKDGVCMWSGNSGVDDIVYSMAQGWAKRMLIIGNPNPCTNFFRRGVAAGDLAVTSK